MAGQLPQSQALAEPTPHQNGPFDINIWELTAILRAFQTWGEDWRGRKVFIHTDSSTSQLGIIKTTLKAEAQNRPLRELLLFAAQRYVVLEAQHIPGAENQLADALSRNYFQEIATWCPHWQMNP